jgi:hypothetical protein
LLGETRQLQSIFYYRNTLARTTCALYYGLTCDWRVKNSVS